MEWRSTWHREEIDYGGIGSIKEHTQRVSIYNNLNAEKIRIRFSNLCGTSDLLLHEVTVGIRKTRNGRVGFINQVRAGQVQKIRIRPGEEIVSDDILLPVRAGDWISISTCIHEEQIPKGAAAFWDESFTIVEDTEGNQVWKEAFISHPQRDYYTYLYQQLTFDTPKVIYGITGVEVYTGKDAKTAALFGDSITHFEKWSAPFTRKIYEKYPGKMSVINCAVAGNMLSRNHPESDLLPCGGSLFGKSGVSRFERSVFRESKIDLVIVLIGANDILLPFSVPFEMDAADIEQMLTDYKELIHTVYLHHSRISLCTICPFQTDQNAAEERLFVQRNRINEWICHDSKADIIIPVDQAVCDRSGERLRAECDSGDGLHPSPAGGLCMAEMIFESVEKSGILQQR